MKVLVLGATGQLGANLVRTLLEKKYEVRAFRRPTSRTIGIDGLPVEPAVGDFHDLDSLNRAMRGCRAVLHAGPYYPFVPISVQSACEKGLADVGHVLKAARQTGIERIVYTSTLTTIGRPSEPGRPADETCRFQTAYTQNPYLAAKAAMEEEVCRAAQEDRLPAVIINPTAFFGPYDARPSSGTQILMIAKRQMPVYVEGPTNVVDVRDVARGAVLALERGRIGERYILGGQNTTQGELNRLISRVVDRLGPFLAVPFELARLGAKTGDLFFSKILRRPPPVPGFFVEMLRHMQHYDLSKARQELGYSPGPIEPAIRDAFQWFRQHGYL